VILVTGAKRSGTSMWMRILGEAGLPMVGEAFPRSWGDGPLREANPGGFFETTLRDGIAWHTNPDPRTGWYLHPDVARGHAVKVFLPGLARTDYAFIEAVVFTVRDWRTQAASVARLAQLERAQVGEILPDGADRPTAAHALEWWLENTIGLRDLLARQYPAFLVSYDSVLDHPAEVIPTVLDWLQVPRSDRAIAVVDPALRRSSPMADPDGLDPECIAVFDELHRRVHTGTPLDEGFVREVDALNQRLAPILAEHARQAALHRGS
jgi:hypothetical protein